MKNTIFKIDDIKNILNKKFTKDLGWIFSGSAFMATSALIINIIIGNSYGSEVLGIFNQSLAIYSIVSIGAAFGLQNSAVKFASESNDVIEINMVIANGLALSMLISAIATISFLIANYYVNLFGPVLTQCVNIMIVGLPPFSLNKVILGVFRGRRKFFICSFAQSLRWFMILIYVAIAASQKWDVISIVLIFPITEIILSIILLIEICKSHLKSIKIGYKHLKLHFIFGLKSLSAGLVTDLSLKLDILILGYFLSNSDVGVYSLASSIVKGILVIPSAVQQNFNPIVSLLWKKNDIKMIAYHIKRIFRYISVGMLAASILLAVIYPAIIFYLMGDNQFFQSLPVFYIMLSAFTPYSIFVWTIGILPMSGHPGSVTVMQTIDVLVNLILNYLLVQKFGIYGAAVSNSIVCFMMIFIREYIIKAMTGISVWKIVRYA